MKRLLLSLIILSSVVVADATKKYSCEIFKANYRTVTDRQKAGMYLAKGTLSINSLKAKFDWGQDSENLKYSRDDLSTLEIYAAERVIMMISKNRKDMILKGKAFILTTNENHYDF